MLSMINHEVVKRFIIYYIIRRQWGSSLVRPFELLLLSPIHLLTMGVVWVCVLAYLLHYLISTLILVQHYNLGKYFEYFTCCREVI